MLSAGHQAGFKVGLANFKIPILKLGAVDLPDDRAMPFRHLTPGRFDLDTLKLMQQAFDTVCAKLQIDESDTRRLTLANEIIRLAEEGERETLAEQAEEALALAMRPRKTGRLLFQNRRVRGQTGLRRNNSN